VYEVSSYANRVRGGGGEKRLMGRRKLIGKKKRVFANGGSSTEPSIGGREKKEPGVKRKSIDVGRKPNTCRKPEYHL